MSLASPDTKQSSPAQQGLVISNHWKWQSKLHNLYSLSLAAQAQMLALH